MTKNRLRATLSTLSVLVLTGALVATATVPASAAGTLNTHPVVVDASGRIVPWTANPGDGYGTVVDSAWDYLVNKVPNDPTNGKPAFYSHSYINPDTQEMVGWPHNPAGLNGMLIESALKYYAYSGDTAPVKLVQNLATWQLRNGMTKSSDEWASVPYSSGDSGSLTWAGAAYGNSTGVGDGVGFLQPDKVGAMGEGFAQLYEFDGNTSYRDAAVAAGDALVKHVRAGTASQSPWPFRVRAADGVVREEYTANVIEPIQLLDSLIALKIGDTAGYTRARTVAWEWLMAYPMVNNNWSGYFEDVDIQRDPAANVNQLIPMMTARYLLQHPDSTTNSTGKVRALLSWVEREFAVTDQGATTIREQKVFNYPMGSHTARYASVEALLAQATGDATAKQTAYYSLNWATYMARSNGVVIDGPQVNNQWFTDGYGDYIRHFLTAMQAFPEWAPAGQSHLTGSTSIVKNITYSADAISYTTADRSATDSFRVAFAPGSITADGITLTRNSTLTTQGYTYDAATGVLRIRHDTATSIRIIGGAEQPTEPGGPTVPEPTNAAPTVSLSSSTSAPVLGADVVLTAAASDSDGTVAKVEFRDGTTTVGTVTSAPFTTSWRASSVGVHSLTAIATDDKGASSTSTAVPVTVTAPPPASSGLPAPWVGTDVGSVGVAGSTTHANGLFSSRASGVDIWDAADSFRFVYQPLVGDGQVTTKVVTQGARNEWALAGVMIRSSLDADSPHAFAGLTPGHGLSFTSRSTAGAMSDYVDGGAAGAPVWVRVVRTGAELTGYSSTDGVGWTRIGSARVAIGQTAYAGIANTSHDNSVAATDTFSDASVSSVTTTPSADVTAPVITNVASGSANQNGGSVSWTTDEPADSRVEYGTTTAYGLSTSTNSSLVLSHTMVVSGLDAGTTYHYRVISRDEKGNVGTSADATFSTPGVVVPTDEPGSPTSEIPTVPTEPTVPTVPTTPTTPPATEEPAASTLPSPWVGADIGAVGVFGTSSYADGVFSSTASGVDIWDSTDSFRIVYQPLVGDGQITARVASHGATDEWALAGVMIRGGLRSDAIHAFAGSTRGQGLAFTHRDAIAGATAYVDGGDAGAATWVRLVRSGTTVTGYSSGDGVEWTRLGSTVLPLEEIAYVGLANTSHDNAVAATDTFADVSVIRLATTPIE